MRTGILAILSLLCVSSAQVSSQEIWQLDYYDNEVLADYIASVEFQHEAVRLSLPIIDLGKPGRLRLDFDDTEGGFKNYTYRLVHCNKDWQPSALDETEYLDGFNGEELPGFGYSSNKYSEYTHYDLTLPNDDVTWMISGRVCTNLCRNDPSKKD